MTAPTGLKCVDTPARISVDAVSMAPGHRTDRASYRHRLACGAGGGIGHRVDRSGSGRERANRSAAGFARLVSGWPGQRHPCRSSDARADGDELDPSRVSRHLQLLARSQRNRVRRFDRQRNWGGADRRSRSRLKRPLDRGRYQHRGQRRLRRLATTETTRGTARDVVQWRPLPSTALPSTCAR